MYLSVLRKVIGLQLPAQSGDFTWFLIVHSYQPYIGLIVQIFNLAYLIININLYYGRFFDNMLCKLSLPGSFRFLHFV